MIRNSIYLSMRHRLRGNYRYAQGIALTVVCLAISSGVASAGVKSEAAREVTEFVLKKFGKETVEEGAERFTVKVEALATRHGDDAIKAVRKVGPQAVKVIE